MEKNLSTFANEMASSAMILGPCWWSLTRSGLTAFSGLATSKSLVLIDELGRGTSPHEGVGISHAIAEALIALKVLPLLCFICSQYLRFVAFRLLCNVSFQHSSLLYNVWSVPRHFNELTKTLSRQPTVIKYVPIFIGQIRCSSTHTVYIFQSKYRKSHYHLLYSNHFS